MNNKARGIFIFLAIVVVSFTAGIFFSTTVIQSDPNSTNEEALHEHRQSGFKYISPLLECDDSQEIAIVQYNKLRKDLNDFISKQKDENNTFEASIYFRDLNNGPWIGINADEQFSPASLLKVPLLIAYLKEAESDPFFLNQKTSISPAPEGVEQTILPTSSLDLKKEYTISDLLYHMIAYSDNNATATLFSLMPDEKIAATYKDLGVDLPKPTGNNDSTTSVRTYSSFFRILFNASYLSKTSSESALELLTRSVFSSGLVAGVDKKIVVAHKFGERQIGDTGLFQLHDCGIVYYPNKPYLLCVMTRGSNKKLLPQSIAQISRITFNALKSDK